MSADLKSFLKNDVVIKMCHAWIYGSRTTLPTVTIPAAIDRFFKFYNLSEETFMKKESVERMFHQLDRQIVAAMKKKNSKVMMKALED